LGLLRRLCEYMADDGFGGRLLVVVEALVTRPPNVIDQAKPKPTFLPAKEIQAAKRYILKYLISASR
jgi:hypothetical protein